MKRDQLKEQIINLCEESGLSVSDKVSALRAALTRVQMNVGAATPAKKSFKPLTRPSGNVMGKQKSQPKEK